MKTVAKTKPTRTAKRDLFAELGEGMAALAEARSGKRTLRTHDRNSGDTILKLTETGRSQKRRGVKALSTPVKT